MTNNSHMDCLRAVADEDIRHLEMKEKTYGGSWKKRGGGGAFMMAARKWDRLENILPADNYDVFTAIQRQPGGEDGSVLAEVRDLRRYLLLIEAEMVARGVVTCPPEKAEAKRIEITGGDCYSLIAERMEKIRDDAKKMTQYTMYGEPNHPGTPDDGGHHAPVEQRRASKL